MARSPSPRAIGELTFPEVSGKLKASSILCLPIGAIEQHGAHLPLNTDVVVAEELTRALIARWGDPFDLWQLPTLSVSLSGEHDWAPGTLSLSIATFAALLKDMGGALVRSLPARNLAIVNGHGGNRGILENLLHELRGDCALNACVIHPFDLARTAASAEVGDGPPQGFAANHHRPGCRRCRSRWRPSEIGSSPGYGRARPHRLAPNTEGPRRGISQP